MNIKLWGVRGSIPTSDPETRHYGGNTSCVQVTCGDWLLILDAGSGMQRLNAGIELKSKRVDILLTHLHFDHIQGLGFFKALFNPEMEVHIWGPASIAQTLRARLVRYFSPPLFPVLFRDIPCTMVLHEVAKTTFSIGPFTINSQYVNHVGPTVGYRVQDDHSVFCYIPDHEPALGPHGIIKDLKWISGSELALDADLLVHDGQYSAAEYKNKMGWGHCSMEDAIEFATLTRARHLLLFHHDPAHTDGQIDLIFEEFKKERDFTMNCELAVEGMEREI